jgi:transcriptional regulator GlxA family with amidase domain
MRISILALEGLFDTGFTVTLDAFSLANKIALSQGAATPPFNISIVGMRKKVRSAQGLIIPVKPVSPSQKPDWVIVLALATGRPEALIPALERRDVKDAQIQLQKWHAKGISIAACCVGAFILAEAGILKCQEATTTWWLAPLFRQRYPDVSLDETRMLVPSGQVVTTGAAMGHLDFALWLIRKTSPELATMVSRYLLADIRSSQAYYIIPNHLAQADPLILRFERWARENLKRGFSLDGAAKALATSGRTLQRRCEAVLGKSPLAYFQDLRVERARALIHSHELNIDTIAAEVGYQDGVTLRTLLRERLGHGVRELRAEVL